MSVPFPVSPRTREVGSDDLLQFVTRALNGGYRGMVVLGHRDSSSRYPGAHRWPRRPRFQHSHLALQPVVAETPHSGLEQRLAQASLRRVEAKEFVFAEGDPTTHIFQVETGAVALYKVLCDGRRQVVGFAYPGDLIGLGAEGEHVMNAQAIKPTRLRCLPVTALNQIARQDPRLGFKLYEALARELAATRDLLLTTGQRSATERVVAFLLAFSRRNERNARDP